MCSISMNLGFLGVNVKIILKDKGINYCKGLCFKVKGEKDKVWARKVKGFWQKR